MANHDRYKEFERVMTATLLANTAVFLFYLIAAGAGIGWLKGVLGIFSLIIAAAGLYLLYTSKELTKPRSLWISCGFFAVICCTLASLILAYPG